MSAKVNAFARWRTISDSQVPQTPKAVLLALALHADDHRPVLKHQAQVRTAGSPVA